MLLSFFWNLARDRRVVTGWLAVALAMTPLLASAQASDPLAAFVASRSECLEHYKFGSVHFDLAAQASSPYRPGNTVILAGTVTNTNTYPLPQGKIIARVLRHNATMAPNNWHPIVSETVLPGDFSLKAEGSLPFSFQWTLPQQAPAGLYRVEFYYLAGGRYVLAGLPYVANFPGGVTVFSVQAEGTGQAVTFDRNSVVVAGQPLALRSVPPTYPATTPLNFRVNVTATGSTAVPVTLRTALYEWSDSDGKPPISDASSTVTITPGTPLAVPFTWESPRAGVYELVLTATPQNTAVSPSIIKVRIPVAGNTPRIIYSGIGAIEGDEATIITCAINGTRGEDSGSFTTQAQSGGSVIGETSGALATGDLATTAFQVPLAQALDGTIAVEAKNDQGVITDSHQVTYVPEPTPLAVPTSEPENNRWWLWGGFIAVALLILILIFVLLWKRRKPIVPVVP